MKQKLKSQQGETLVETLFSMLVVALAVLMLTGAIVSAARVNARIENQNTAFTITDENGQSNTTDETIAIRLHHRDHTETIAAIGHTTKDTPVYYFYEHR